MSESGLLGKAGTHELSQALAVGLITHYKTNRTWHQHHSATGVHSHVGGNLLLLISSALLK